MFRTKLQIELDLNIPKGCKNTVYFITKYVLFDVETTGEHFFLNM